MTIALYIALVIAFAYMLYTIYQTETVPIREDFDPVPAPKTPPGAGAPEEAERPTLPGPIVIHLSVSARETLRAERGEDYESRRWEWAAWAEAQELIRELEEGA